MTKSARARSVLLKLIPSKLKLVESILESKSRNRKNEKNEKLGLSLDYDSCLDILQTKNGLEMPNPFEPRNGYISSTSIRAQRLAIAHYFMRALLESISARYATTTLFNSSYNQSRTRTREFASIARAYKWRFSSIRNTTDVKNESHAGFKRRTFTGHVKSNPKIKRFIFADDLKNNVNSIKNAKLCVNVTAIHFDYSMYVSRKESLSKFVDRALVGTSSVVSPSRFRTWAKLLSKI